MKRKLPVALLMVPTIAVIAILAQTKTQSAPKTPEEIGNPPLGMSALEFIGKMDQMATFHKGYGYLTHIDGLADQRLFTNAGVRDQTTARFTFAAEGALTAHHKVGNLITTSAEGHMAIYFNEVPVGDFNDPTSFAKGQLVARYSGRFHSVCDVVVEVNLPSPGMAIITMGADLEQDAANGFRLDGDHVHLGRKNLSVHLSAQAHGIYTQAAPTQQAQILIGGNIVHSR